MPERSAPKPPPHPHRVILFSGHMVDAPYRAVAARLANPPQVMPAPTAGAAPPCDARDNPLERCNRWLLDTALARGGDQVWLLCLWDGQGGDGAGGTAHMVGEVQRHHGHVIHIDCRRLWQGAGP